MSARSVTVGLCLLGAIALSGCKSESDDTPPPRGNAERTIVTVQSYVYATPDDAPGNVATRIRDQVRSAFGALKALRVTASNREVSNEPPDEWYREPLVLLWPDGTETVVLRVWFRFTDEVTAPSAISRGTPILVGALHRQDEPNFTKIVTSCTANTARERDFRGRLQLVFDGSLQSCQDAILGEQAVIDAARVRLDSPEDEIVPEEYGRVYIPVVARLLERKVVQMGRYPRFEAVMPQAGRSVSVAALPTSNRATPADDDVGDPGFGVENPIAVDEPRPDKPTPIVIPGAGVEQPRQIGGGQDPPHDPDAPPDPEVPVPVVVAGNAKGNAAAVVQPPMVDGDSGFDWEDLLDKKFLALWFAVFALYPLLRRRGS
ncbi:MAG: hypothetical protein IPK82_32395 [Polyangiaceae bacterium]|nr:hypothetical protein [Polyangiaceae bacterium]